MTAKIAATVQVDREQIAFASLNTAMQEALAAQHFEIALRIAHEMLDLYQQMTAAWANQAELSPSPAPPTTQPYH